jgi:hypothetical protein
VALCVTRVIWTKGAAFVTYLQTLDNTGSSNMPLTSATYAALQASGGGDSGIGVAIGALLAHLNEFPDMLNEEERRMRLER